MDSFKFEFSIEKPNFVVQFMSMSQKIRRVKNLHQEYGVDKMQIMLV